MSFVVKLNPDPDYFLTLLETPNDNKCDISASYGVVGEQAIEVIKATAKAQKEQSEANAAQVGIKEEGVKKIPSSEKRPAVPEWIKKNADWYGKGQITENDFVQGLEWMINNGIIRIESVAIKEEGVK